MSPKPEPLTGEQRLSLLATAARWEWHHRQADARKLADAFFALLVERDQLTAALTAVDQDAQEARMERDLARTAGDKARILAGLRGDLLHETRQKLDAAQRAGRELQGELDKLHRQIELDSQHTALLRDERDHLQNLIDGGSR
jgi:hypothetical protein